jgi:transcriptional regulator with XRE-family HTH domain
MRGRFARCAQSERSECWAQIGRPLRARRTRLGLSISSVAQELGIGADQYLAYETGARVAPTLLPARIAEYFGVPALWLSPKLALKTADAQKARPRPRGRYRVTTVEDRENYLISVLYKLDLERQRQLLAVASALAHQA